MQSKDFGYIRKVETMGMVDGPGVRTILFLSGCPLRCLFCHNPDMWKSQESDKITVEEVIAKLKRFQPYYGKDGGVTFCGGEPLSQPEFLYAMMKRCKEEGISTCLDTSGYGRTDTFDDILSVTDVVLYDIKGLDPKKYKDMTAQPIHVTNTFIQKAIEHDISIWIRVVIIPGINDTYEYMDQLAEYIRTLKHIVRIELLPYHTLGVNKYGTLGISYPLDGVPAMDQQRCKDMENYLIDKVNHKTV